MFRYRLVYGLEWGWWWRRSVSNRWRKRSLIDWTQIASFLSSIKREWTGARLSNTPLTSNVNCTSTNSRSSSNVLQWIVCGWVQGDSSFPALLPLNIGHEDLDTNRSRWQERERTRKEIHQRIVPSWLRLSSPSSHIRIWMCLYRQRFNNSRTHIVSVLVHHLRSRSISSV